MLPWMLHFTLLMSMNQVECDRSQPVYVTPAKRDHHGDPQIAPQDLSTYLVGKASQAKGLGKAPVVCTYILTLPSLLCNGRP